MPAVHRLEEITAAVETLDLVPAIEAGFVAYSRRLATVPPVGELIFRDPPGDAHIKYGYLEGDDVFVIKVATGFFDNPKHGLPGNSGLMLVFSSRTGMLESVLLDEGYLTNVRTALAGAISARWLAPPNVEHIAILGTGLQARMQAEAISRVTGCRSLIVWGRRQSASQALAATLRTLGYTVETAASAAEAAIRAQVVVTATASKQPILNRADVLPGTHIVAMGSDTASKNELAADLAGAAHLYVADSISQCADRGELHHALAAGTRMIDQVVELGELISAPDAHRRSADHITIADLTGVAVQDIAIAKAVCAALGQSGGEGRVN